MTVGPGPVAFELGLPSDVPERTILRGLSRAGFSSIRLYRTPSAVRVLACVAQAVKLQDRARVHVTFAESVSIDLDELAGTPDPTSLGPGYLHELVFLVRKKTFPTLARVKAALVELGFEAPWLFLLKNGHTFGTSKATTDVWYARSVYRGPETVLTAEDPIFFETISAHQPVGSSADQLQEEPLKPTGRLADDQPTG